MSREVGEKKLNIIQNGANDTLAGSLVHIVRNA